MAIEWGAWEGSGNAMRVGIDVDWEVISHIETAATATVKIYTQNNFSWDDDQSLNFGGSIGGSDGFHNGQGDGVVTLRSTKTYTYNYWANEYGSSPGSRTFTAKLSGAYNGITPSKSVTKAIPARPIGSPAAPANVSVQRVGDGTQKVTWTNKSTTGEPWQSIQVQRSRAGGDFFQVGTPWAGATSFSDSSTDADEKYQYRVRAENSVGESAYIWTGLIFTTPSTPTNVHRTGPDSGAGNQVITWSNNSPGYTEYETQVWAAQDGVWSLLATKADGVTSHTHTSPDPTKRWKYRVRHKTTSGVQETLYSPYGSVTDATTGAEETDETQGSTHPPNPPTSLSPNGLTLDPSLAAIFKWTHNPTDATSQTKYEVQHRLVGATAWTSTGAVTSGTSSYTLPKNTYADGDYAEWRVRTWGNDPTASPWSAVVSFSWVLTPIPEDPIKLPVLMNLQNGELEASTTAYELRNYIMRAQTSLSGGGVRAVDATYGVSWSDRFLAIGIGSGQTTMRKGYHDITQPNIRTVSNRALTSELATLTISTASMHMRVGEYIYVSGVGAPFDGFWRVTRTTASTLSYEIPGASNVTSGAAPGGAFLSPRIQGHGRADNWVNSASKIPFASWDALYYELPFGWGAGSTPRKNGVTQVTNKQLTSNVATLTTATPHFYAVGDRLTISGVGSPFDGDFTVTGIDSAGTVSYSVTNANIASTAVTAADALVTPTGKDAFRGNFHQVSYTGADFVVPDNWILLALRNTDLATIEWVNGDTVDPGYDSDSPVFKQALFTSVTDAASTAGNKPAIRVGNTTGDHLRIDGNEIIAMNSDTAVGALNLNVAAAGDVNVSASAGRTELRATETFFTNLDTTTNAANAYLGASGKIYKSTSTRRAKTNIRPLQIDVETLLSLDPHRFNSLLRDDGPDKDYIGFIAEEAEAAGLEEWVERDENDRVIGFQYTSWVVALQEIVRYQRDQIEALDERLVALETKVG